MQPCRVAGEAYGCTFLAANSSRPEQTEDVSAAKLVEPTRCTRVGLVLKAQLRLRVLLGAGADYESACYVEGVFTGASISPSTLLPRPATNS